MVENARPATAADVARIVELAQAMRDELVTVRGGSVWVLNEARPLDPSTYETLIADGNAIVVTGTIDDAVIGFATADVVTLQD